MDQMKMLRHILLFASITFAPCAFTQSGVDAVTGADDKAQEKWNADRSAERDGSQQDGSGPAPSQELSVEPAFPGGQQAMMKYITKSFHYPDSAAAKGISGSVYVEFTVTATGAVDHVKVKRGVEPSLDAEAVRVVSAMPKWRPAKNMDGQAIAVSFVMPIRCDPR